MIVGHTKFSLDRHFGTIKKLLKRIGCASILDLLRALGLIKKSAQDNEVMTYRDPITGEKNFEGFKFDEILSKKYGPVEAFMSGILFKSTKILSRYLLPIMRELHLKNITTQ